MFVPFVCSKKFKIHFKHISLEHLGKYQLKTSVKFAKQLLTPDKVHLYCKIQAVIQKLEKHLFHFAKSF